MSSLLQDLRYGSRLLVKSRRFTVVAVFTLGLGIGANAAIFSVINGVMLKPFSFPDSDRLVVAWERCANQGLSRMVVSPPNFADWRQQNQVFQDMAAYRQQDFNLIGSGDAERVRGLRVSATMFSMLGVRPLLGRDFEPDEDKPGAPATVILSHGFFNRRFGASPSALGQSLMLGKDSVTIIGVMPPEFDFPPPITFRGEARPVKIELWTQLRYEAEQYQRSAHNLFVIARLKTGVSLERATTDLQAVTDRLATTFPDSNDGWDALLVPLQEQVVGDVRTAMLILPGAVCFVLLIACANVANLLLVRAAGRQREMAIRAALGAGRWRLLRQMLIECTLLSLFGGVAGLGLAAVALKLIAGLAPQNIYRLDSVSLDGSVVVFTLIVSLLTAVIFSLAPGLQASRISLVTALKEGSSGASDGPGRHHLRNLLVIAEVALALLLLTGAGLLIRSFIRLQSVPTGFQPEHLAAMTINLPSTVYPDRRSRLDFTERLMPKLAALPMLQSVAFSSTLPLDVGLQGTEFKIEGQRTLSGREPHTYVSIVSPGYFQTMGTPLLQGNDFSAFDRADAAGVVIINSFLAQTYFAGQDPVGKRLEMGFRSGPLQVIGVVADERQESLQTDAHPGMYLPYAQAPTSLPLVLLLRTSSDLATVATAVREQITTLDAQLPVYDVKTMDQVLHTAVARPRFVTLLLGGFAGVAVLLATVGIYGVMSYTVAQNTREIGIRLALGAQKSDVLKLVVGQGLVLTMVGVVIGLASAFALTRMMSNLLYGVSATDPVTFIAVPLCLVAVAFFACYVPASRAAKVDPMVALHYE